MRGVTLCGWALVGALPFAGVGCATETGDENVALAEEAESQELVKKCPRDKIVDGIDVSEWQGPINFHSVKNANYEFAIARAASGIEKDETFGVNWPNMRKAGLVRGVYQYFRASQDGVRQANALVDIVNRAGGLKADDLPPIIDVEEAGSLTVSQLMTEVREWVATIKKRTGRQPIIYTNEHWEQWFGNPSNLGLPLWVAKYTKDWCPEIPAAWSSWVMWQFTDKGSVPGIRGNVDLNRFNGTLTELKAFIARTRLSPDSGDVAPDGGGACGSLTAAGACDGTVVHRCVDGAVRAHDCATHGMKCGWSAEAGRNDCI